MRDLSHHLLLRLTGCIPKPRFQLEEQMFASFQLQFKVFRFNVKIAIWSVWKFKTYYSIFKCISVQVDYYEIIFNNKIGGFS